MYHKKSYTCPPRAPSRSPIFLNPRPISKAGEQCDLPWWLLDQDLGPNCTVKVAANIYLERRVFKVNEFIRPSHLEIYWISVPQYLESLERIFNPAKANLRRMGAMHGHCTSITVMQQMKRVMGDLKSLLGYSIHKMPHTSFSDPHACWKRDIKPTNPNLPQELPPQGKGPRRRGHTFNHEMDIMIVHLAKRLSNSRATRIPWDKVHRCFNRTYPNVATKQQVQDLPLTFLPSY